ncbi:hypothetical protein SLEP1_g50715 [Rubroshorea leprosula]|uniref:Uncharacterized protein n=1 Tax=Rubroshorea leprosula TaxID=152421 RepID=A0AAV5M1P8_9ROSI|nr:hypothetical protein SLEP1_g50715 [Rubroshorea leprosula]
MLASEGFWESSVSLRVHRRGGEDWIGLPLLITHYATTAARSLPLVNTCRLPLLTATGPLPLVTSQGFAGVAVAHLQVLLGVAVAAHCALLELLPVPLTDSFSPSPQLRYAFSLDLDFEDFEFVCVALFN